MEGDVYDALGRVDVWDLKSGNLVASSGEMPRVLWGVQISADGFGVIAGQALFQLTARQRD